MSLAPNAESSSVVNLGSRAERSPTLGALALLVPAWQPDDRLPSLVRALAEAGFGRIVVVDDGSSGECAHVFAVLETVERVTLLRHAVNHGKGRALKTGFGHVLSLGNGVAGVVTADADGQHTPEDIVRVGEALLNTDAPAVVGVRTFTGNVPLRSRLGNLLTRRLFSILTGTRVRDTQTGLRGLRSHLLPALVGLGGERYEYEITVLAHLCRSGSLPLEVPIATVYLEGNRGSHFHPLWDSLRIYGVLLRFAAPRRRRPVAAPKPVRPGERGAAECARGRNQASSELRDRPALHPL